MHLGPGSRGWRRAWRAARSGGIVIGLLLAAAIGALAQDLTFFRIGTGSSAGTYFPVGGIIASAISNPPGSRACDRGGSCGVPGLIAVAQSTNGSVDNIEAMAKGQLESAFCQADVAYWAYHGSGIFENQGPITNIRAIANLYPESVHLVVHRGSGIREVGQLRGKRVSVDREGSGTRVDAILILEAYGLGLDDIDVYSVSLGVAADMLRAGELDAFFMVAGVPANAVRLLANDSLIDLIPIAGAEAEALRERYPYFSHDTIGAGTYLNVASTETLSVGAQWIVAAAVPEETVYEITRALWHENTRRLLNSGHPQGRRISLATALDSLGIPLHAGAERYYREVGVMAGSQPPPEMPGSQ